MSTRARKERKRAGVKFVHPVKEGTTPEARHMSRRQERGFELPMISGRARRKLHDRLEITKGESDVNSG